LVKPTEKQTMDLKQNGLPVSVVYGWFELGDVCTILNGD
jgi:hypothetical protein